MNEYHKELVKLYSAYTGKYAPKHSSEYTGTGKKQYPINTPSSRKLVKDWLKKHPHITPAQYKSLLDSLSQGKSHNEFSAIGKLLEFRPTLRKTLDPSVLDRWLDFAEGWAEVDSICQSNFTAEEMLSHWPGWQNLIKSFSHSSNIHKRRASLVLLTGPVRHSSDDRISKLAFMAIDSLRDEKDILLTKAISWLLRNLISFHRQEVEDYLSHNKDTLPTIAVRETRNKLKSGRKSGK